MARRFPHAFEEGSVSLTEAEKDDDEKRGLNARLTRSQWGRSAGIVLFSVLCAFGLYYYVCKKTSLLPLPATPMIATQKAAEPMMDLAPGDLSPREYAVVRQTQARILPVPVEDTVAELRTKALRLVETARALKASGVVMETSIEAKAIIRAAQEALQGFLRREYGHGGPYRVEITLQFPESMPDFGNAGADATIVVELAPIEEVPYCVFYFLEIVKGFKSGAFHRNAGHVQQAMVSLNSSAERRGLAWQEYSSRYPHKQFSLGFAGRPGGPAFYISTVDNTDNHGPASQGSKSEADGCFGRIAIGKEVVRRMSLQPGRSKPSGFVSESKNFIKIKAMKLLPALESRK